ncbi:MAG: SpoIIE family protein phosphatase [Microscillaceae bacterium]|nr:SpoIIE family protein phosphatase [Microscillaceae bacterium]MDW8459903.1 HAMP domain-containing protein [Cytophagales bacterium]
MKISKFFTILFVCIFSVLTLAGIVIYFQVYSLRNNIENIVNKKEPFEKTVLEMETIASAISNAVLGYINNNQIKYRNQVHTYRKKFEKHLKEYKKYAETQQEIRLGKRLDTLYKNFMNFADSIINISNLQQDLIEKMKEQAIIMKEVPEYQLSKIVSEISPANLRKTQLLLQIRSINEDMLLSMGNYIITRDVRSVVKIVESEKNYPLIKKAFLREFPADTAWFNKVDKSYTELVRIGHRIISVEDDKRHLIVNFKNELNSLDALLNKEIQPLIVEGNRSLLAESKNTAFYTVNFLTLVALIMLGIFFFVHKLIRQWIISPLLELYRGIKKLERGQFSQKDLQESIKTKNEIGDLAIAFGNMASNLKKSFEDIQTLWKEQIELTEQLALNNRELEKTQSELLASKMELEVKVEERTAELREERNRLTASINYAKRIQEAMLPLAETMRSLLQDYMLIYKPRDIVSGDFYWIGQKNDYTIVAAVDCTGHGVPGAFMSMIGNELLNEIVQMRNITRPDLILNELHKLVRKVLQQEETHNSDGMDIALVAIHYQHQELLFAGAKNPLVYLKTITTEVDSPFHLNFLQKDTPFKHIHKINENKVNLVELVAIKGDIMPIGGIQREQERLFTLHTLNLATEKAKIHSELLPATIVLSEVEYILADQEPEISFTFYLFSDGFQDQFGGERGRKFTTSRLYETLLQCNHLSFEEQKHYLEYTLKNWMQGYKQLDDILLLGFRV